MLYKLIYFKYFKSILTWLGILFFIIPIALKAQLVTIDIAKNQSDGAIVTIEGIITTPPAEPNMRFIQDESGGIGLINLDNGFNQNVRVGDQIRLTGELNTRLGQKVIQDISDYSITGFGLDLPDEIELTSMDSRYSGMRVLLSCVQDPQVAAGVWESRTYNFLQSGVPLEVWVLMTSNAIGQNRGGPSYEIQGVLFEDASGWHIIADNIENSNFECLNWVKLPELIASSSSSLTYSLKLSDTAHVSISAFRQMGDSVLIEQFDFSDTLIEVTGLESAEIYDIQWAVSNSADTLYYFEADEITQSTSSKVIRVFFNNPIRDSILSPYEYSLTGLEIEDAIVEKIDQAKQTISLALYNFNNDRIRSALDRAHNRGIIVRALVDANNGNFGFRPAPDFPVFYAADGSPLMHNKFIIIDEESPEDAWLFMGGTNLTRNQVFVDPNSSISFQDQMLAKVFLIEFNELYGSSSEFFNTSAARNGSQKLKNTPDLMFLNETKIESHFSPSDGTTQAIVRAIQNAEESIYFSLLTFTQNDISRAVLDAHNRGVEVYGIIENIDDNGGEFYRLQGNGVKVLADNNEFIHHHKYAIIDPLGEDPRLIVGSHNWTQKAEDENDEHTLILYDRDVSLLFLEEFYARYCAIDDRIFACNASGSNNFEFTVSVRPNPVEQEIIIHNDGAPVNDVTFTLMTANGVTIDQIVGDLQFGNQTLWERGRFPAGMYFLSIATEDTNAVIKLAIAQ